jgi:AraC family transcriptional regulator
MAASLKQMHPVLSFVANHLDEDLSLSALADQTGLSPFHLHRTFAAALGETPKQLAFRLRLSRAAAMLLGGDDPVLDIAISSGFQSHEVFCRAFRRRFGTSPSAYRARGLDAANVAAHAAQVQTIGPCIGLYHFIQDQADRRNDMTYSITTKEIAPQPVLLARRRVKQSEISATIGEALPRIFLHAQRVAAAVAGPPYARYVEWGPMITIEPGIPVAAPVEGSSEDGIIADTLPGGLVATTMHMGPYDKLAEAYAAIQQWIEANGFVAAAAPWEVYITDPADFPDPADWKTELFWSVKPK